jgi:hypothetical protein
LRNLFAHIVFALVHQVLPPLMGVKIELLRTTPVRKKSSANLKGQCHRIVC